MPSDMNRIEIEGNLVDDPIIKTLPPQNVVATVRIANDQYFPQGDGAYGKATTFITAQFWNENVKLLDGLKKGSYVKIEGKIGQDEWEKDGRKFSQLFIRGKSIEARERPRTNSREDGNER